MRAVKWMRTGALMVAAALLSGCYGVEDTTDLRQFVQAADAKPVGRIPPLPEFAPYESFLYRATSLRGPFEPLVKVEAVEENGPQSDLKPNFDRPKEPLESFKLESLRMVGSIKMLADQDLSALILDGDGLVHRVETGHYIGRNFGEIIQISETQMDLMEIVPDGRGGWMRRPRSLVLVEKE